MEYTQFEHLLNGYIYAVKILLLPLSIPVDDELILYSVKLIHEIRIKSKCYLLLKTHK